MHAGANGVTHGNISPAVPGGRSGGPGFGEAEADGIGVSTLAVLAILTYVVAIRTAFMWVTLALPLDPGFNHQVGVCTEYMQILLFMTFALGVSIPTINAAASRRRSWRALWRLHPLWHDLVSAFPGIPFQRPAGRRREVTRTDSTLDVRLDRWTQDIADIVEQLRHHASPVLLPVIEEAVDGSADPQAAAEALWIKAALANARAGYRHDLPAPALPGKPIADTNAEAAWLLRVEQAYTAASDHTVRELLLGAELEELAMETEESVL